MAGGDFDGDDIFVIADPELIALFKPEEGDTELEQHTLVERLEEEVPELEAETLAKLSNALGVGVAQIWKPTYPSDGSEAKLPNLQFCITTPYPGNDLQI